MSTYAYVDNSPLNNDDPSGMQLIIPDPRPAPPLVAPDMPPYSTNYPKDDWGLLMCGVAGPICNSIPSFLTQQATGLPPGVWPGDKGGEEWGRRQGVGAKEGRRRFHGIKQNCPGSKPKDVFGVDPKTGDVYDPEGEVIGNLEGAKAK